MKRPRIFYARMWLGQALMRLGAWIEPVWRFRTSYDAQDDTITYTTVPEGYQ